MWFIGGGALFKCADGVVIRSDSLAYIGAAGLVEFIGNVEFVDSLKTLTSKYAQYIGGQERKVIARDSVMLTDRKNGSTVRAPYLEYYQVSATRPEPLVNIYSGRPRATMIRTSADGARTDTTIIDSDAMQIHGERIFIGTGNVVMTRGATRAYGNQAHFDQAADSMFLAGKARILSEDYQLHGDTIFATMTPGDEFREVVARTEAKLESEDLRAEAPNLRILFEKGEVHRLIAVGTRAAAASGRGEATAAARQQAVAFSTDFRLRADSIDALTPAQTLEKVTAIGAAFGERVMSDSATGARPSVAASDWMRGDTILATFVAGPERLETAAADTATRRERLLDTITAIGLAQSLYALYDQDDAKAKPAVSYTLAHRIEVRLRDGEVAHVNAEGVDGRPVHGLYLQPDTTGGTRRTAGRTPRTGGNR
jgi:lipopolysaccharide export system protein LptA